MIKKLFWLVIKTTFSPVFAALKIFRKMRGSAQKVSSGSKAAASAASSATSGTKAAASNATQRQSETGQATHNTAPADTAAPGGGGRNTERVPGGERGRTRTQANHAGDQANPPRNQHQPSTNVANQHQQTAPPANQQQSASPANQQQSTSPANQQQSTSPANQQQSTSPANQQQSTSPANQHQQTTVPSDDVNASASGSPVEEGGEDSVNGSQSDERGEMPVNGGTGDDQSPNEGTAAATQQAEQSRTVDDTGTSEPVESALADLREGEVSPADIRELTEVIPEEGLPDGIVATLEHLAKVDDPDVRLAVCELCAAVEDERADEILRGRRIDVNDQVANAAMDGLR